MSYNFLSAHFEEKTWQLKKRREKNSVWP